MRNSSVFRPLTPLATFASYRLFINIFYFCVCVYIYIGNHGLKRVPHIRRAARPVRVVRVQKSTGDQKQNAGRDSNVVQTRIVQINRLRRRSTSASPTHTAEEKKTKKYQKKY